MKTQICLVGILAALVGAPTVYAQSMIYDNGSFAPANAWEITSYAQADDFTLAATQTFDLARVWLVDLDLPFATLNGFSGTLSWFIYSNNTGIPGAILSSGTVTGAAITTTDTGVDLGSFRIFQADFSLPSTTLGAGTYWFRVKENGLTNPSDGSEVFWVNSGGNTGFGTRQDTNPANPTTWGTEVAEDRAFQLLSSVSAPEPGAGVLLLLGAAGFLARRRR